MSYALRHSGASVQTCISGQLQKCLRLFRSQWGAFARCLLLLGTQQVHLQGGYGCSGFMHLHSQGMYGCAACRNMARNMLVQLQQQGSSTSSCLTKQEMSTTLAHKQL